MVDISYSPSPEKNNRFRISIKNGGIEIGRLWYEHLDDSSKFELQKSLYITAPNKNWGSGSNLGTKFNRFHSHWKIIHSFSMPLSLIQKKKKKHRKKWELKIWGGTILFIVLPSHPWIWSIQFFLGPKLVGHLLLPIQGTLDQGHPPRGGKPRKLAFCISFLMAWGVGKRTRNLDLLYRHAFFSKKKKHRSEKWPPVGD